MKQVLVTGANGFVGSFLANDPRASNFHYLSRSKMSCDNSSQIGCISETKNFTPFFDSCSVVIYLAAVAHTYDFDKNYIFKINHTAVINFAKLAAEKGVKRFIYVSTVSVLGEHANIDSSTKPDPTDFNAKVRKQTEAELKNVSNETGMELVIIRSPLIYGKAAPGNFGMLLNLAKINLPLPLGAINNQRSFVAIDNLIDLIITCVDHPKAAGETFLVSDDEDVSTSTLLKKLILAAGKTPLLVPIPVSVLKLVASIVGKKAMIGRLANSLTVDIAHTKNTLNWAPPISLDEGIRRCFK